ncbi:preprotein translocase subunit SecG [bacterium]|nr:preprotein translocase subunit SecG [bacterium]
MLPFIFWLVFFLWLLSSAVLVLVVLVQSGKGGGLSGLVGAGSTLGDHLGATGAEKTLNRWTTVAAVVFLIFTIFLVFTAPKISHRTLVEEVGGTLAVEQPAPEEAAPVLPGMMPEATPAPEGMETMPPEETVETPTEIPAPNPAPLAAPEPETEEVPAEDQQ